MSGNSPHKTRVGIWLLASVILTAAVAAVWWLAFRGEPDDGVFATNGRIEAVEVNVATKLGGRVEEVVVREGDIVAKGGLVARLDTATLEARRQEAQAQLARAKAAVVHAVSVVDQRDSQCALAEKELDRAQKLSERGHVSDELVDQRRTGVQTAQAACRAAEADVTQGKAAIAAAEAVMAQIQTDIEDSTLRSPVDGQVLYRLAEPGEVLAVGGRVVTIIDFSDFYMTVYLPAEIAGRVAHGDPARVLLDAFPERPLAATISFISPEAQFTPKEVETAEERQKMTFRAKLSIAPEAREPWLKPGMTGLGYILLEQDQPWPDNLH
ncbi:MAG: HlyD family secretion protein [Alphaproteobacteria bacterium]